MKLTLSPLATAALFGLLVLSMVAQATEIYCSSQNTGADNTYYPWQYMSNGNCTNHCNTQVQGTFAFAVIQWEDCWCSNFVPQQQTDLQRCGQACPGYPVENCGSKQDSLYICLKLNGQPSGTAGGSRPTSPSSNKPATSLQTSGAIQTSLTMVSESGGVVTKTIILTPSGGPSSSPAPITTDNGSNSQNIGAIVGGAVGGVLGLVAIVGGILFFLWRRRQKQRQLHDEMNSAGIGGGSNGITRNTSTMSSAGLLGRGNTSQYPTPIATNFGTANSRYGDQDSISPVSNRRNSQPLVIDSRLNPKAVLTFANPNSSRDSLTSLDDSRDYGRQLNVRNPDP